MAVCVLPDPSPGDIFFDIEADPYVEDGLEYLFGVAPLEDGEPTFRPWWVHDPAAEKKAFESFIDFVQERRHHYPDLHIYPYAHYEPTALKRLAGKHGTCEDELDDLLRGEVLVDLYKVVRHGLRISQPGYSLKDMEIFYFGKREADAMTSGDSIIAYERWLESGDDSILDDLGRYNEEDCLSTLDGENPVQFHGPRNGCEPPGKK